jgi:WD40 repeat protein
VFVSSTFNDLKAERDALARWVFPALRRLCEDRGYKFQPVDLRWGVRAEAARDQQTVRVCLDEVARCKKLSPRPNFIVLLGDRYGWRPPPTTVSEAQMESIFALLDDQSAALLKEWYRLDENAVPAEYVLQPRRGRYEQGAVWEPIERALHDTLEAAATTALGTSTPSTFTASATELEVLAGALADVDANEHVFGFFREIPELREESARGVVTDILDRAPELLDQLADGSWDKRAHDRLETLKRRLRDRLGANVWSYRASFRSRLDLSALGPGDGRTAEGGGGFAPGTLCAEVWQRLSRVIGEQMNELDQQGHDPVEVEKRAHETFATRRREVFVGRSEPLGLIASYLEASRPQPLLVLGPSGSGKTALMAQAAAQARHTHQGAVVVERYIGATPGSFDLAQLLAGISRDLARAFDGEEGEVPTQSDRLIDHLRKRLALATNDRPAFVFIDAVDQLDEASGGRDLRGLLTDLPEHARLVVSTLSDGEDRDLAGLLAAFEHRDLVVLEPLARSDAEQILASWSRGEADDGRRRPRRLTRPDERRGERGQLDIILEKFQTEGSPLYLKLAYEHARRWHSYDGDEPAVTLPDRVEGMIDALFARLSDPAEHGALVVSHALSFLAAARFGLSEDEMLDLLWRQRAVREDFERRQHYQIPPESPGLPAIIWSRLYADLEPFLTTREVFGVRLLTFYHRRLEAVAARTYLDPGAQRIHGELAQYFLERWQNPDVHAQLELVAQLSAAGRRSDAEGLLLSYAWMQSKLRSTAADWLVSDYRLLEPGRLTPCGLVLRALEASTHVLRPRPDELASQLVSQLMVSADLQLTTLAAEVRATAPRPCLMPVRSCHAARGPLVRTLSGHDAGVYCLASTGDDLTVVSGSHDRTLKVWDVRAGTVRRTLQHGSPVIAVAMTPDGLTGLSAGYGDPAVKRWDVASGRLVRTFDNVGGGITTLAIDRAGRVAASAAAKDVRPQLWNAETGEILHRLEGHGDEVSAVALAPDGRTCVSTSEDTTARVWDVASGRPLIVFDAHKQKVGRLALAKEGELCITISASYTAANEVRVWETRTGKLIDQLQHHEILRGLKEELRSQFVASVSLCAVALSSDGRRALLGCTGGILLVWDVGSAQPPRLLGADWNGASAIASGPNSTTAISATDGDASIRVWDTNEDDSHDLEARPSHVTAISLINYQRRALSQSFHGTINVWDVDSGTREWMLSSDTFLAPMEVAADGRTAAVALHEKLEIWDLGQRRRMRSIVVEPERSAFRRVRAIALAPNATVVATAPGPMPRSIHRPVVVKVWDVGTGGLVSALEGLDDYESVLGLKLAITPDGGRVVSGSRNGALMIWNVASARRLHALEHGSEIQTLAVTRTGRAVVSGGRDGTLNTWDIASGQLLDRVAACSGEFLLAADGRTAVAASPDGTVEVWDLERGTLLHAFEAHEDRVEHIAITSDARLCVFVSDGETLVAYDLARGERLARFTGEHRFTTVAVTDDCRRVVAGDTLGRVHFLELEWTVDPIRRMA